jgi:hypothetical protein
MRAGGAVMVLACALSGLAPTARAGVTVALLPTSQTVAPGADFDVFVTVTQSGSTFNAFDVVIGHDPGALTLLPLSPLSLQEGSLMKNACANTFHQFRRGTDRDTATDVLLCNQTSVTGPGQIYRVRFRASNTPQPTTVQFLSGLHFYDAGISVTPVTSSDATVSIEAPVGVASPGGFQTALRVRATPNPAHGGAMLRIDTDRPGMQDLLVLDALGRVVRHLERGFFEAAGRTISWDGRSDTGERLPVGLYTVRLRTPTRAVQTRLVLLD